MRTPGPERFGGDLHLAALSRNSAERALELRTLLTRNTGGKERDTLKREHGPEYLGIQVDVAIEITEKRDDLHLTAAPPSRPDLAGDHPGGADHGWWTSGSGTE